MRVAAIYVRVSTTEQAEHGMSLENQLAECQSYAILHGYQVPDDAVFSDAGQSAKTTNRPKFMEMLEYCRKNKGKVDAVLVWKSDRFSRNAMDLLVTEHTLRGWGVAVIRTSEYSDDSPTGQFMKILMAGQAQLDNDIRSQRSKAGMRQRLEQGGWTHQAPVGYENVTDALGRPTLKPSSQADLITRWFREYLKGGYSKRQIHQLAADMGIRGKDGKPVSYQLVLQMLANPLYAGFIKSRILGDRLVPGLHEGLITYDEFESIQLILTGKFRAISRGRSNDLWPLRGFVRCYTCKKSLTGSSPRGNGGIYNKYSCTVCRKSVTGKAVSEDRDVMHERFRETLSLVEFTEGQAKLFRETVTQVWNDQSRKAKVARIELEARVENLSERKRRVLDLLIDGKISATEKDSKTSELDIELAKLKAELAATTDDVNDKEAVVEYAASFMMNLGKLWVDAEPKDRLRFQSMVFPEGIEYEFGHGFRTAKFGLCIATKKDLSAEKSLLVTQDVSYWNRLFTEMKDWYGSSKYA